MLNIVAVEIPFGILHEVAKSILLDMNDSFLVLELIRQVLQTSALQYSLSCELILYLFYFYPLGAILFLSCGYHR